VHRVSIRQDDDAEDAVDDEDGADAEPTLLLNPLHGESVIEES